MHEMTIVSNILNIVLETGKENNLSVINRIKIKVGKQHHLAPDLMKYAFDFLKKGTIAAPAVLEVEKVPVSLSCRNCSRSFTVQDSNYICPSCGSVQWEMVSGRELTIETIEGER